MASEIELAWAAGFFDEFTPENIYTYINRPTPARLCRACNAENTRSSKARRRAAKVALSTVEGAG